MDKVVLHTIEVQQFNQKVNFQIKLPSDAKAITKLKITSNFPSVGGHLGNGVSDEVGSMWLRSPYNSDVFYSGILKHATSNVLSSTYTKIEFSGFSFGIIDYVDTQFLRVNLDANYRLIEGFYVDHINTNSLPYKVNVYLYLETKSICCKQDDWRISHRDSQKENAGIG